MDLLDLFDGQFMNRIGVATSIGDRRRAAHLPAVGMIGRQLQFALPRLQLAALAAGVAKLDGGHRTHVLDDRGHPRQALDLGVVIDAGAACAGAAIGAYRQLFGEHQAESSGGA